MNRNQQYFWIGAAIMSPHASWSSPFWMALALVAMVMGAVGMWLDD